MTFAKKMTDYLTGLTVLGIVSLVLLIVHVVFPKHGAPSLISLFGTAFWTAWLTLMVVFAVVYFFWVFFFYKEKHANRLSRHQSRR